MNPTRRTSFPMGFESYTIKRRSRVHPSIHRLWLTRPYYSNNAGNGALLGTILKWCIQNCQIPLFIYFSNFYALLCTFPLKNRALFQPPSPQCRRHWSIAPLQAVRKRGGVGCFSVFPNTWNITGDFDLRKRRRVMAWEVLVVGDRWWFWGWHFVTYAPTHSLGMGAVHGDAGQLHIT